MRCRPCAAPSALDDFTPLATAHGVTASVLVQVLPSVAETGEFLAVAASGTVVAGVVGWADLTAPDVADQIARLRELPGGDRLAGLRHLVQDEPDPDWLDRPDVRRGLRALAGAGLVYDLLVRPAQLPAAIRLARDLPGVSFVLDHGGKPDIARGQYEPWARLVGELAACPNVVAKLSGLVTEAGPDWSAARIGPYASHLIDAFGAAPSHGRLGLAGLHPGRQLRGGARPGRLAAVRPARRRGRGGGPGRERPGDLPAPAPLTRFQSAGLFSGPVKQRAG